MLMLASNMALQRTRDLVAVGLVRGTWRGLAVQALSGGRSPLNAGPLGGNQDSVGG